MAIKPWVKISAETITWGNSGVANGTQWYNSSSAWNDVLQDWRGWMQEGILDLNIPMNYYRHHNTTPPTDHATGYTNWMNFAKDHKFNRQVAISPGIYLNYTSNAIIQMRADSGGELELLRLGEERMRSIRGNKISMVFQEPGAALNPVYTIGDQISEVFLLHRLQELGCRAKEAGR